MAPFKVSIKHAGKTHEVQLDTDLPTAVFKDAIYQVTGVPVDRMKVMAKGTVIKVYYQLMSMISTIHVWVNRMIPHGRKFPQRRCVCRAATLTIACSSQ
jgi:hypothetical protein